MPPKQTFPEFQVTTSDDAFFCAEVTQRAQSDPQALALFARTLAYTATKKYSLGEENGTLFREWFCQQDGHDPEDRTYLVRFAEISSRLQQLVVEHESGNSKKVERLARWLTPRVRGRAHYALRQGIAHGLFEGDECGYHPSAREVEEAYAREEPQRRAEAHSRVDTLLAPA